MGPVGLSLTMMAAVFGGGGTVLPAAMGRAVTAAAFRFHFPILHFLSVLVVLLASCACFGFGD